MSRNSGLLRSKREKNDEFYTQISDIEQELKHYKHHFKDKVVFLNCDDPEESHFFIYFAQNFEHLGLKKLISTHYHDERPTYKLEVVEDINDDGRINLEDAIRTPLSQNGDFRSEEAIEALEEADIVVTNPPFSLFREYIAQLIEYDKKFLVLGNMGASVYKEIFPLVKEEKLWFGCTAPKEFKQPDGTMKKFGNIYWYTNLNHNKRHEPIILYKEYNEEDYPKYDGYNIINVDKVKDIPKDYYGIMGVPITYLTKHCPEQFEIVGATNNKHEDCISFTSYINGKVKYVRVLIKRKR